MNPNFYLSRYDQIEVASLIVSGSIIPSIDMNANLIIQSSLSSLYSSSITILLRNFPVDSTKVETKYDVSFTEL
jgi:hypothetical protein